MRKCEYSSHYSVLSLHYFMAKMAAQVAYQAALTRIGFNAQGHAALQADGIRD
jgi:hypothetical protein